MKAKELKEYIYENRKIEYILQELQMHHLKWHDNNRYITFGVPNGDNKRSTYLYNDENLNVKAETRNIVDKYGNSDIISLVCFVKDIYFSNAIKYLCDLLGLDYYSEPEDDLPESLKFTKMIEEMNEGNLEEKEKERLNPISEKILTYYKPYVNDLFKNDGISYATQREFGVGYDLDSHRITIPIYDDIGNLVGIKGRLFKKQIEDWEEKYIYLERCAKSHILYGLHKTLPYIKNSGIAIVGESEKSTLQLWDMGFNNAVAVGSHDLSAIQVEKLTRLGVKVVLAYDKDVPKEHYTKEINKFIQNVNVEYIYDTENILNEKESPSDNKEKFLYLYNNCRCVLR